MNSELNFEIAPFEWTAGVRGERETQAFDELGDLETGEEFERGGQRFARGSAPASRRFAAPSRSKPAARGPVRAGGSRMRPPMRPPRPKPRPSRPGSWSPAAVLVRDPYRSISEPFPSDSTSSAPGTEIVRWAQDCLNHAMGLRLAVNGVMGVDTRSALRRFQGQQGLRVNGILGPDTEEALRSACRSDGGAAQAETEFIGAQEEEIKIPLRLQLAAAVAIKESIVSKPNQTYRYYFLGHLDDTAALRRMSGFTGLYLIVFIDPQNPAKVRAYSGKADKDIYSRLLAHRECAIRLGVLPRNYKVYILPLPLAGNPKTLRAIEKAIHHRMGVRKGFRDPSSILTNPQRELEEEMLGSEWN